MRFVIGTNSISPQWMFGNQAQIEIAPRTRGAPTFARTAVGIAVATGLLLFALAGMAASPVHAGKLAQSTTVETILTLPDQIREWTVQDGFVYWHEACLLPSNTTRAFLKRRAVNGAIVQTLVDINDADACETLLGLAVDNGDVFYYNRDGETIEAIYASALTDPPTPLATVGRRTAVGFGDGISAMFPHEEFVYWMEVDINEEFVPDDIRIRRVSRTGGAAPETLIEYTGYFAGYGMAFTPGFIWWVDGEGLQRMPKPPCPGGSCTKDPTVHEKLMRRGRVIVNDANELFWWDADPTADVPYQILRTVCPPAAACSTQIRYTAPDLTSIGAVVANTTHIYWTESVQFVGPRLMRRTVTGGAAAPILEDESGLDAILNAFAGLALDEQGVYFQPFNLLRILRLPLDAAALQREISFGGWEVTQAIQNVENVVPLLAGKQTFVRVYPALNSGSPSAGVEALLHGTRGGMILPGSPLRPINGVIAVISNNALANRGDVDGGWLFQLPLSWTKTTDAPIPLEDASLTLRVELDPKGLTGDTTPGNNSREETFTFIAKAPACVNLRPVWTEARYQSPWDISVGSVIELSESVHPTVRFLAFPDYNRLSKIKWCWKGPVYGPFCSGPYDLNKDDSGLLTKMGVLDFFHDSPSTCFLTGARTLYAGIVSAETQWDWAGLARRGKDQSLSKVPRYGTWSWPLSRQSGLGITFVHEVGHNYNRRHIDCGGPKNPDSNYPYATDTLDDRALDAASTHFGFDSRLMMVIPPDANRDYMSYCGPRWISDYTWKAIFNNTRKAGPLLPFSAGADTAEINASTQAEAYVLASGLITPSLSTGELSSVWTYPTADAGEGLIQKWEEAVDDPWTGEPYHVRVLGADGEILADRAVVLFEVEEQHEPDVYPFHVVFPAPDGAVHAIQLLEGETTLHSYSTGASAPVVTILAPQGGESVQETFTLQWSATDPDGAPWLVYSVQYSLDLGQTWHSLLVDQPGLGRGETESLLLDLRGQPGSEGRTALLRVLASDGYNTGLATSAPFSVAPRAPDVLIIAPEDGQWFSAGEPVSLRGDAFDPEDGVLGDEAFQWSLPGLDITGRTGAARGLAPGAYTASLQATDSDGQSGNAQASFYVAPLNVPLTSEPILDGKCDDMAYTAPILPLSPYTDDGIVAHAAVARTGDHLWVCLQSLEGAGLYAGFQLDVDNSQEPTAQPGDLGFFVQMDGSLIALAGDGNGFVPMPPTGLAAQVSGDESTWSAELRLDVEVLGGWNRRVALGVGHYRDEAERAVWPHSAVLENPQSWAQTNLGAGQIPHLAALTPISTVVGSSVAISVTGADFQADTIVLWEGAVLTPTFVDEGTLLVTVDAGLLDVAGLYSVQVAPGASPQLASTPRAFLVYHPRAAIASLTPDSALVAGNGFTLIVEGQGFVEGATVLWNGDPRTTTYVSPTRLEAMIGVEDIAAALPVPVAVANPDPNEGISLAATFTILPPPESSRFHMYLPGIQRD